MSWMQHPSHNVKFNNSRKYFPWEKNLLECPWKYPLLHGNRKLSQHKKPFSNFLLCLDQWKSYTTHAAKMSNVTVTKLPPWYINLVRRDHECYLYIFFAFCSTLQWLFFFLLQIFAFVFRTINWTQNAHPLKLCLPSPPSRAVCSSQERKRQIPCKLSKRPFCSQENPSSAVWPV